MTTSKFDVYNSLIYSSINQLQLNIFTYWKPLVEVGDLEEIQVVLLKMLVYDPDETRCLMVD